MRGDGRRRSTVVLTGATLLLASSSPAFAQLGGSGSLTDPLGETTQDVLDDAGDTVEDGLGTIGDTVDDVPSTVDDLVGEVTDELLDRVPHLDDLDDELLDDEFDDVADEEDEGGQEPAPAEPRDASGLRAWLGQDHGLGGVPYDPNVVQAIPVHDRSEAGAVAIAGDPSAAASERPATRFVVVALVVLVAAIVGLGVGRWLSGTRSR